MSYLSHYKIGDALFRTLSEIRLRAQALRNRLRFSEPPPRRVVSAADTVPPARLRPLSVEGEKAGGSAPFLLELPGGRVAADGTCLTPSGEAVIAESTTDFHRRLEHHALLYAGRLPAPETFSGTLAVIASPGSDNYFHWTLASLPRFRLLERAGAEPDAWLLPPLSSFHREWLDRLGIPPEKRLPARPDRLIRAERLLLPSFDGTPDLPSPDALAFLRGFLPSGEPDPHAPRRLFVSRARARRRRLLGEERLFGRLEREGFRRIFPGEMTVAEQMRIFAGAEIVVAPHGAELTNLVWCRPGTRVVELLSDRYRNPCFRRLAGLCGLDYSGILCPSGEPFRETGKDPHWVWSHVRLGPRSMEAVMETVIRRGGAK